MESGPLPKRRKFLLMYSKKNKKTLAFFLGTHYNNKCCDMIAMKREVAAHPRQVFRGANVKEPAVTRLDESDDKSLYKQRSLLLYRNNRCVKVQHSRV